MSGENMYERIVWRHGARCWRVLAAPPPPDDPVLLVHGVMASAAQYLPLARALARRHRAVWAVDLPGFGVTPALPASSVDACIDFVARFVARLTQDYPSLIIVAHSFGAFLVQAALNRRPEIIPRVARVVLVSVGCLYPTLHLGARDRWRTLWWAPFFRYRLLGGALRALARAWPALGAGAMRAAGLETCARSLEGESMLSECLALGYDLNHRWTRPCAAGVAALARAAPVALLWGAEDALFSYAQAKKFALEHGVRLGVAPGVGHSVLLHPRAAAWIAELGRALRQSSSASPVPAASACFSLLPSAPTTSPPPRIWLMSSTISDAAKLQPA